MLLRFISVYVKLMLWIDRAKSPYDPYLNTLIHKGNLYLLGVPDCPKNLY